MLEPLSKKNRSPWVSLKSFSEACLTSASELNNYDVFLLQAETS